MSVGEDSAHPLQEKYSCAKIRGDFPLNGPRAYPRFVWPTKSPGIGVFFHRSSRAPPRVSVVSPARGRSPQARDCAPGCRRPAICAVASLVLSTISPPANCRWRRQMLLVFCAYMQLRLRATDTSVLRSIFAARPMGEAWGKGRALGGIPERTSR